MICKNPGRLSLLLPTAFESVLRKVCLDTVVVYLVVIYLQTLQKFELSGCTLEELLTKKWATWERLCAFLDHGKILWTGNDAYITRNFHGYWWGGAKYSVRRRYSDSVLIWVVVVVDHNPTACNGDFLVGLLAKSEESGVCEVDNYGLREEQMHLPLSERGMLNFLTKTNGNLQKLRLGGFDLKQEHFRAMANAPDRPGLDIVLYECIIDHSAGDLFLECLARNRGPTELEFCEIEAGVLVDALCGSMRLKTLRRARFSR